MTTVHKNVKTVFMDIDDTLWENNIFFLASLAWVCREARAFGHTDQATTNILNHMENFNIQAKGYGYDSYEASLLATIRQVVHRTGNTHRHSELHQKALAWGRFLRTHPIAWLTGVEKTLPDLTKSFKTIIVTKGHPGDQMAKVNRCGLKHLFHAAEVVPHKYPECYSDLLKKHGLDPQTTVMVGNSPRSDINMARRAGLRTVYIPHPKTWYREVEPIGEKGPLNITISTFDQLLNVLAP